MYKQINGIESMKIEGRWGGMTVLKNRHRPFVNHWEYMPKLLIQDT
jgi:hypothetical protein